MKSPQFRLLLLGLLGVVALAAVVVSLHADRIFPLTPRSPVAAIDAEAAKVGPGPGRQAVGSPRGGLASSFLQSTTAASPAGAPSASGASPARPASAYSPVSNPMKKKSSSVVTGVNCPDPVSIGSGEYANTFDLALDEVCVKEPGRPERIEPVRASTRAELAAVIATLAASSTAEVLPVLYIRGEVRSDESRRLLAPLVTVKLASGTDPATLIAASGALSFRQPDYAPDHAVFTTPAGLAALEVADKLAGRQGVESVQPQLAARPAKYQAMPNDPLVVDQWHLKFQSQSGAVAGTDINVESVWAYPAGPNGLRGKGVRIGIVDDSLQTAHPDLAPNYESTYSYDWNSGDADPNPVFSDDNHGTSCAGDAAGRGNNGIGGSGSAPEATLVGMRLIAGSITDLQIADAMSWYPQFIDLKSNSWGFGPYFDNFPLTLASMANAAATGRAGLGSIFLFAAGNSGQAGESPNYNALQNSIHTICVAAFDSLGRQSFYSEPGANIIIAGPSNGALPALGKTTTDRTGTAGYNSGSTAGELADPDYTQRFGGTSSATPTVAGVVALMLEAKPGLGWRDVQEILLRSSRKVVPTDPAWVTNEAGINHNPKFGAGLVDAAAAVALARTWTNLGAPITRVVSQPALNKPLPDNNPNGVSVSFTVPNTQNIRVEHVRLNIAATHTYRGDLRVVLRSPTGIESELAAPFDESGINLDWTYTSVRNWGENGAGTWTLRVSDEVAEDTGVLNSATLTLHGTSAPPIDPPPVVTLLDPPEGGRKRITPGQTILLRATATDSDVNRDASPIADFRFLVDGQPFPDAGYIHSPVAPGQYEYPWAPPMGTYRLSVQATDSAGKVSISAEATLEVRYPPAGSVREEFVPPSADNHVQALAADPQGRVYIGGLFTNLDGDSAPRIARLTATGSVDPTFYVGIGPDAQVRALLHVPQDKGLYVGGHFANVDGTAQRALVRLRTGQGDSVDGSVDPAFAPTFEGANSSSTPYVRAIVRQDDGKILVGGFFSKVNGVGRTNLVRLNPDGTLDTSFAPNPGGAVHCLALQSDGKILVGGSFTQVAGLTSRRIARLNRDGTVDTSFVTGTGTTGGFDGAVNSIAVTLDGEVIAGGQFTSYNGRNFYNNMAKLLPSGAVDGKFNFTPGLNGVVNDLHLRPTGTILVSGLFTSVANNDLGITATPVGRIAQMLSGGAVNGTLDADFNPGGAGANGSVLDSITLANGDILVGGAFTTFNGVPRERLAVVAGFEASSPMITSPLFRSIDAGSDLDFAFESAGEGTVHYAIHSGALPRGVRLNSATGKLEGIPLDAGRFKLEIVATSSVLGSSDPTGFVLHVNEKKVPYAQWKRAWFSAAEQADNAISAPGAVRNSAGLSNFLVYALGGGDPDAADASLWPVVQREKIGTKHYLTLSASKYPGADAVYRGECSSDLTTWGWGMPGDMVSISEDATHLKVRAATPATEIGKQFLRLKVLAP